MPDEEQIVTLRSSRSCGWCFAAALCTFWALVLPARASAELGVSSQAKIVSTGDASSGGSASGTITPDLFTGSFSYPIPIEVPAGRGNMQPDLFVTYRSTNGNGWLGVGWQLELGSVERSTRSGVNYSGDDFIFKDANGASELVRNATGEYRAKIEGAFTRVRKLTAADGQPYFEATDKSGTRYLYGRTTASRQYDAANASRTLKWALDRVEDPSGNYMRITYERRYSELYPYSIDYTGYSSIPSDQYDYASTDAVAPTNYVRFYRELRVDSPYMYVADFEVTPRYRLKTIDVVASGKRVRAYNLAYARSSVTLRSVLNALHQYGKDASVDANGNVTSSSPPIITQAVTWPSQYSPSNAWTSSYDYDSWASQNLIFPNYVSNNFDDDNTVTLRYPDVNGDGKKDACIRHDDGLQCMLSTGSGFSTSYEYDSRATGQRIFANFSGAGEDNWGTIDFPDLNGDGKADACWRHDAGVKCWISTGLGWSYVPGYDTTIFGNEFFLWSLQPPLGWRSLSYPDVNADGNSDVCFQRRTGIQCLLSTGTGFQYSAGYDTALFAEATNQAGFGTFDDDNRSTIRFPDVNGDRRDDACVRMDFGLVCYLSTGSGFAYASGYDSYASATYLFANGTDQHGWGTFDGDNWPTLQYADVNGDGKADACMRQDFGIQCALSTGQGWAWKSSYDSYYSGQYIFSNGYDQRGWGTFDADNLWTIQYPDVNGDGKADACIRNDYGLQCWLSTGSGWVHSVNDNIALEWDTGFTGQNIFANNSYQYGYGSFDTDNWKSIQYPDVNGDGRADPCIRMDYGLVCWPSQVSRDLVQSISNGIGGMVWASYAPSSLYSNTQLPIIFQVLSTLWTYDGVSWAATSFSYANGYFHFGEAEFRGFGYAKVINPAGPSGERLYNETWYHQGNDVSVDIDDPSAPIGYTKGKPYRARISDQSGRTLSMVTTIYEQDSDGAAPWFTPPDQTDTAEYDGDTVALRKLGAYDYDAYGNVAREYQYGDTATAADDRTIETAYMANTSAWILDRPSSRAVHKGIGAANPVSMQWFYYDDLPVYDPASGGDRAALCDAVPAAQPRARGNLTRVSTWLAGGSAPEQRTGYDKFGNEICARDPRNFVATASHDSTFTYVTARTNALGHTTRFLYHGVDGVSDATGVYGLPWKSTDPNLAETTTEYDVFGRRVRHVQPDGFQTTWKYLNVGTVGAQHVRTDNSLGGWSESYFDGKRRNTRTRKPGAYGRVIVETQSYDLRGAVANQSLPYFEGDGYRLKTFRYDARGRVLESAVASYASGGALVQNVSSTKACFLKDVTVMLDENGHRKRETRDAFGQLVRVEEYSGTYSTCTTEVGTPYAATTYEYDTMGNLRFVTDVKGNQTEHRYDTAGRRYYSNDPDMGVWTYSFDPGGKVVAQTNALGKTIQFSHDALGRVIRKQFPSGGQAVFGYDEPTSANGIGRLTSMSDPSGDETYEYDPTGQTRKVVRTDGNISYVITSDRDGLGRPRVVTYGTADKEVVAYEYDAAGNLLRISGDTYDAKGAMIETTPYATYSGHNALGQPTRVTFGNGVETTYTYRDQSDSRLESIATGTPTQTSFSVAYGYDAAGNVTGITDRLDASRSQTFMYDELNRLKEAQSGAYGTLAYSYDEIGNIVSKEGVIYAYDPRVGVKPHAVVSTSDGRTFSYDANGNTISDGIRTFIYDDENRPTAITAGNRTTQFVYDGTGKRVKKSGPNGTTTYVGGVLECTGKACGKYIMSGETRIALRTGLDVKYYHADHLGSTAAISDRSGAVLEAVAYYPYGATRTDTGRVRMNHKFTGQELDSETDLYFYGARYYDPQLGKFITPDSLVVDGTNPQELNRYAYALNNPLRYTDPTGHSFWDKVGDFFDSKAGRIGTAIAIVAVSVALIPFTGGTSSVFLYVALGEVIGAAAGGIAAARAGGDISAGILVGTIAGGIGGATGFYAGPAAASLFGGAETMGGAIAGGAAAGALNGAAMGVAGGYKGGAPGWKDTFWESVAVGAAAGAVVGGAMGGIHFKLTHMPSVSPGSVPSGPPQPGEMAGSAFNKWLEKAGTSWAQNLAHASTPLARDISVMALDAGVVVMWDKVRELFRVNPEKKIPDPVTTPKIPIPGT